MPSFPFEVTTTFLPIVIEASASAKGKPIGQGQCVGIYLYLNSLAPNSQTNTATNVNQAQIYFGDANTQQLELVRGNYSKFIYCKDLSEIYVRCNGIANTVNLTAIVYTRIS